MPDARLSITSLVNTYVTAPSPSQSLTPALNPSVASAPSPQCSSYLSYSSSKSTETPYLAANAVHEFSTTTLMTATTATTLSSSPSRASYASPPPSSNKEVHSRSMSTNVPHHTAVIPTATPTISLAPQTTIVKTPRGKRHRCTYPGCGRDFTRLSNLKAHWRRHSGEQPYACMHCGRKFKWRSSLKSHELGCVYEVSMSARAGNSFAYAYSYEGDGGSADQYKAPAGNLSTPYASMQEMRFPSHNMSMSQVNTHTQAGPRTQGYLGAVSGTQAAVSQNMKTTGLNTFSGVPLGSNRSLPDLRPMLRQPHHQYLSQSDITLQNGSHENGMSAPLTLPAPPYPSCRTHPAA